MRRYRPNKRGIEDRKLDKLTDEESLEQVCNDYLADVA
jgi:hypothetical protein